MLIIIPARLDSSRLPGKVLLEAGGKPLILWTVEAALRTDRHGDYVVVASDSHEVLDRLSKTDWRVQRCKTGPHSCGTDRAAFALACRRSSRVSAIVLQADEPLIQPEHIRALEDALAQIPRCDIATLCTPLTLADQDNPNVVKVDVGEDGIANEFRRTPMTGAYRHIGVYAFPPGGLQWFAGLPKSETESLEQTRALHAGARIRCVTVEHPHYGIDTAEQFEAFRRVVEGGRCT